MTNPFIAVERLQRNQQVLAQAGIGDTLTVSWEVDGAYGGGEMSHTGSLKENDGKWIRLEPTNRSPGHFYCPISGIKHVQIELVRSDSPDATLNPFLRAD